MLTPSLAHSALTLRRFAATDEEADIADVLEHIQGTHFATRNGMCRGCASDDQITAWPCQRFIYGQHLAVQYIGRAADRVAAHAKSAIDRSKPVDEKRKFRAIEESA